MLAFALALIVLIVAAARPQRSVAKPATDGAVMLAEDISSSMQSTDVTPSRLEAARRAAQAFLGKVPSAVQVGLLEFSRTTTVLQSPTSSHEDTRSALAEPVRTGGGTAVGKAITTALQELQSVPRIAGKRPPGAIVLISDGTSNVGVSPLAAARQAAAQHIPIFTISVGTPDGTIPAKRGATTVPVPVSRQQLAQIAKVSGGRTFATADASGVSAAYAHLAARLGHKMVKQEITAGFAGGGLVLLLLGGAISLRWFGRLI
jgi:Ca-activated chloride channel family protein